MDLVSVDFLLKNDQNQWQHTMILIFCMILGLQCVWDLCQHCERLGSLPALPAWVSWLSGIFLDTKLLLFLAEEQLQKTTTKAGPIGMTSETTSERRPSSTIYTRKYCSVLQSPNQCAERPWRYKTQCN